LEFRLEANLVGEISFENRLDDADFTFYALFDQRILQHVRNEISALLSEARNNANSKLKAAESDLKIVQDKLNHWLVCRSLFV
jgi:predicted Zn-dependent peptidase